METSIEAYKEILETLGERQSEVLKAIRYLEYCTNTMISKHLNLPINSITPRTNELRKKGLVIYSHTSRCPITKRRAMYWKINGKTTYSN